MEKTLQENADYLLNKTYKGNKQSCLSALFIAQSVILTMYAGESNQSRNDIEETIKYLHSK